MIAFWTEIVELTVAGLMLVAAAPLIKKSSDMTACHILAVEKR